MKQLRTLAVAAALAGAILGPASTARAETIRDGVMGFSIAFPGDADREELEEDLPDWVHRVTAWEQHDERGYYNILVVQTLPDNYAYNDVAAVLRDARGECVVGAEVVEEKRLDIAGGLGTEVLTRRSEFSGVIYDLVRLVVKKNKFYCVRGTYREGDKGGRARSFVRSLQVF